MFQAQDIQFEKIAYDYMQIVECLIKSNQIVTFQYAIDELENIINKLKTSYQPLLVDLPVIFILFEQVKKNITFEITCKCLKIIFKLLTYPEIKQRNMILQCGFFELCLFLIDSSNKQIKIFVIQNILYLLNHYPSYYSVDQQIMIVINDILHKIFEMKLNFLKLNTIVELISNDRFQNTDIQLQLQIMDYLTNFLEKFEISSQDWHIARLAYSYLQKNRDIIENGQEKYYYLEREIQSVEDKKSFKALILMKMFIQYDKENYITFQQEYVQIIYSIIIDKKDLFRDNIQFVLFILADNCYQSQNISEILNFQDMARQLLKLLMDLYLQINIVEALLVIITKSIKNGNYAEVNLLLSQGLLDIYKYYIEFVYNQNEVSIILDSLYFLRLKFFWETELTLYYYFNDNVFVESLLQYDEEIQQKVEAIINYPQSKYSTYQFKFHFQSDSYSEGDIEYSGYESVRFPVQRYILVNSNTQQVGIQL